MKTATITDHNDAHTIRTMKYSVSPVVRVAVQVKNAADLPKLVDGLKKLSKSDPLVVCTIEETGQHVIAGCGELHIEICLKDLEEDYAGCPIIKSDPIVTYKETVTAESSIDCMSKSPNKHNRITARGAPLEEGLAEAIEKGTVNPKDDPKDRSKYMHEHFGWDRQDAGAKLWSFGPENTGPNVVVDMNKGI
jgi:elongation factor 2